MMGAAATASWLTLGSIVVTVLGAIVPYVLSSNESHQQHRRQLEEVLRIANEKAFEVQDRMLKCALLVISYL
jgi:hypothetical protein